MAKKKTEAAASTTTTKKLSPAQQKVKDYLDNRAAEDKLFAKTYAKKNKSFDRCWSFIIDEMRKKASNNVAVGTDDEVFGLAVHYYDEDDLAIDKKPSSTVEKTTKSAKVTIPDGTDMPEIPDIDVDFDPNSVDFDFDLF